MITIIGASCIDIICQNVSKEIFEKGHQFADNIKFDFGGDGLNESIVLSRLGKQCELITVLGDDEAGKYIYQHCIESYVRIVPTYRNSTYISTILVDKSGRRNLIGTKYGNIRELMPDDVKEIRGNIVCFASMFIPLYMKAKEYEELFKRIKNENKILCADTTTIKNNETIDEYKDVLNKIDYFFPNDVEAKMFTRADSVEKAADILFEAGVKNVVIKVGENGCYLKNKDYAKWIATKKVEAIDSTGAGDSFVAGFIKCLDDGKDIIECCNFANECGGKTVQVIGATDWL
ncbi:MAG: carbohydrate kinase family protein [Erysipelotrichaceae bacterium]|nr:carbohydrate kinase family protein [Erysipelotrichaceae bacterium]